MGRKEGLAQRIRLGLTAEAHGGNLSKTGYNRARKEKTMGKLGYSGKLFKEFWDFAKQNKVYWIVPLGLLLGLVALLVATSQASAPFIYTLF